MVEVLDRSVPIRSFDTEALNPLVEAILEFIGGDQYDFLMEGAASNTYTQEELGRIESWSPIGHYNTALALMAAARAEMQLALKVDD